MTGGGGAHSCHGWPWSYDHTWGGSRAHNEAIGCFHQNAGKQNRRISNSGGEARKGEASPGKARQGKARQGTTTREAHVFIRHVFLSFLVFFLIAASVFIEFLSGLFLSKIKASLSSW